MDRPATPPPDSRSETAAATTLTPEAVRRIEESRLRAKAIREQREAERRARGQPPNLVKTPAGIVETPNIQLTTAEANVARANAGRKRPLSAAAPSPAPTTNRDGRANQPAEETLRPAKKFAKFVDWNLSTMTDSKGGFLSAEDDPTGEAARVARLASARGGPQEQKPKHMSEKEWERLQVIRKLRKQKSGPYQPGLSVLDDEARRKKCRECESLDVDWVWEDVFKVCVCGPCKERLPDKYSLLTKTECREDYLLTEPELRDTELLPHLSRPNPHKSHWHDMMLFLRFQVEEYAFGPKKWGSAEALDAEFEKRETDKTKRKEAKFKDRLADLKRKTRTEAILRRAAAERAGSSKGSGGIFADTTGSTGRHVHEWGRVVENEDGTTVKTCLGCGMEVEELEF